MKISILFCLIICFSSVFGGIGTFTPLKPSETYTHLLNVFETKNPGQYVVYWKLIDNDEIQFELHVKTTGWIGFGLSPNGDMTGADIAIGWVDNNNTAHLRDCYATSKSTPIQDKIQNLHLLDAAQLDGYTILKYKRKINTCDDEHDRSIVAGNNMLILAWNNEDPLSGNNDWQYHGQNRIQRSVLLLNYKNDSVEEQKKNLPSDVITYTYRMPNLKVPPQKTYYYCDIFEVPQFDSKAHLIQFEMLINEKHEKNVHHLLVYECDDDFSNGKQELPHECGPVKLPQAITSKCMMKLFIAWGIGGQYNYTFPIEAGYPFYPTNKKRFMLFEMHYDNPTLRSDIVDDSGIKFYFTQTQLRKQDLGLLSLGLGLPLSIQIPPKSDAFELTNICYPDCTTAYIPDEGITAVGGLLHTHIAGRAVRTDLIRNGVLIEHLMDNQNYDFNYQFIQDIEPVKIYKGDVLKTKCVYNTQDRSKFTFFGFATTDEMCFDFLYYYPKIDGFEKCASLPSPNHLYNFYRSLMKFVYKKFQIYLTVVVISVFIFYSFIIDLSDKLLPRMTLFEFNFLNDMPKIVDFLSKLNHTEEITKRFNQFFKSEYNRNAFCGTINKSIRKQNLKYYKESKTELTKPEVDCSAVNNDDQLDITKYVI